MQKHSADFSVLMSVYNKENPEYLRDSLMSVFNQTLTAKEVILIKDGPVTDELNSVICQFEKKHKELHVIPFEKNRGLGKCLNDGIKLCSYDIIARMDTDDIAKPERFEEEYNYLAHHPECDIVGSWIEEFISTKDNIIAERRVPQQHKEIYEYAKRRCPVNHPTVMYRKNAVMAVGGYLEQYFPEDYFLWIRMLMNGSQFYNINKSLLWFRYSPETIKRRGGWKYAKDEIIIQHNIYKLGFISLHVMIENIAIRFSTRILPYPIRKLIYKTIRKH
ncbi:glycosyltransferase [Marseilla massiliensis]|uniref:Glycosyltransferase n=1 Tax=Marseilla massiliensis TaxID=1841864 RepID=A0A938WUL8_9BACT|nr:glycosyltransferase [Marseilla massiliensis]MBM6674332.1 glycosyltransferase [Marseilla massiliensis]